MQRWGSSRLSSSRYGLQTYKEQLNSLEWDLVRKNHIISISQIINLQVKSDWLDGAEDARRYDFSYQVPL